MLFSIFGSYGMQLMSGISPFFITKETPVILVADDDKSTRMLLRDAMEKEGYRVVEVSDGKQCLDVYASVKPDLVLLDAVMPIMDGFTCCKQLSKISSNFGNSTLANPVIESSLNTSAISVLWNSTPILMITGLDDPESVDRAFEAGATDYVTKPIHWAVLRQRVRRLLQQAQLYKKFEAATHALQELANIDGLTGVANRRRFDHYLNIKWLNLAQEQLPLSLILCDIDYFKLYNDKYGHPAGDVCLQKVAAVLNRLAQRNEDLVARYGGEEFAVIMPNTHAAGAVHVAASIQGGVRELQMDHSESEVSHYLTLSLGVATTLPSFESSSTTLVVAADKALYQAKAEGRNRIILKQLNC